MKTHLFNALKITMLALLIVPNLATAAWYNPWSWGANNVPAIQGQEHYNLVQKMRQYLPVRQHNLDNTKQVFRDSVRPALSKFSRNAVTLFDQCQQGGSIQCAEQAAKLRLETIAVIEEIETKALDAARSQEKINQDAERTSKQCEDYEKRMAALKIDPLEQFKASLIAQQEKEQRKAQRAQTQAQPQQTIKSFFNNPFFARFKQWFQEKPEQATLATVGAATIGFFGLRRGLRFFRPIHVHNHTHTTQVAPKA